jgi:hypothetical protein
MQGAELDLFGGICGFWRASITAGRLRHLKNEKTCERTIADFGEWWVRSRDNNEFIQLFEGIVPPLLTAAEVIGR